MLNLDLEAGDRVAAEAGLGERRQLHRVIRYVPYALRVFGYVAVVLVFALATQANPWGLLASVLVIACVELAVWFIPPSKGVTAVIRYDNGLGLAQPDGSIVPLPWGLIEDCAFQAGSSERSMGSTRIYFAQFHLRLSGVARPLVLIHLRRPKQLAAVVSAALEPYKLQRLIDAFDRTGRVDLGGKLVVTREGLIIGTSRGHRTTPLPWAELTKVEYTLPSTLVLRAGQQTYPEHDDGAVYVDGSAAIAAQFIAAARKAAR